MLRSLVALDSKEGFERSVPQYLCGANPACISINKSTDLVEEEAMVRIEN